LVLTYAWYRDDPDLVPFVTRAGMGVTERRPLRPERTSWDGFHTPEQPWATLGQVPVSGPGLFGYQPVGSIGPTHVRKWLAAVHRKSFAPGTTRNANRLLKLITNAAFEEGCIEGFGVRSTAP
jgi:hypothetical protein